MKQLIISYLCLIASVHGAPKRLPSPWGERIVGGVSVPPGGLPYQISLQWTYMDRDYLHCGGSIYSPRYIICAAHCVYGEEYNARDFKVYAGESNVDITEGTEQLMRVEKFIVHEDYQSTGFINDISLLKLKTSLVYNKFVAPISISATGPKCEGPAVVSGWGSMGEQSHPPSVLKKVTVDIISDEKCRKRYGNTRIKDSMICTYTEGKDACTGDSGGPLAVEGRLCGVVSWGRGCARPDTPGVYTEVAYFTSWIERHTTN